MATATAPRDAYTEMMERRAVDLLVPLQARVPATEEGGGDWLPIMPAGRWMASHLSNGIYEILAQNLAEMAANHDRKVIPIELAVNEGHYRRGPALGWIQQLKVQGDQLWARVTWTPIGQTNLDQQLYRYVSPEWWDAETPYTIAVSGEKVPWVLGGLALTNNPFFVELPAAAERLADGSVFYTPLTAVWEETENQIRHRVREPGDFRPDTFRTVKLAPSAVRKVEVGFTVTEAMAGGVSMILGKLKPDKVPDGNDADSMVLQAMRFTRKTDTADGWTIGQAKEWWGKSTFSQGADMSAPLNTATADPPAPPAPPVPDPAALAAQAAENARLKEQNEKLLADAAEAKKKADQAAIRARFGELKVGGRVIAPAHADRLAIVAMALPEGEREDHVKGILGAISAGLVDLTERGGVHGDPATGFSSRVIKLAQSLGVSEEWLQKAAAYAPDKAYQDATIAFRALYLMTWEQTASLVDTVATTVIDNARTITYQGLGAAPRMREWLAERQPAALNAASPFPVTVRDWEASIEVRMSDFIADNLGQYAFRIQQMAQYAKRHPDALLLDTIVAANSTLCYDGQDLCDDDHSEGESGTQDNKLACAGDDTTAHILTDLAAAQAAMLSWKDDRGQYQDIGGDPGAVFDIFCRPAAMDLFKQINVATSFTSLTPAWAGRLRIHSSARFTSANKWWFVYAGGAGRPFIVQYQTNGQPSDLQAIDSPTSEHVIKNGSAFYGTKGHYIVVPGDWRYIIQIG